MTEEAAAAAAVRVGVGGCGCGCGYEWLMGGAELKGLAFLLLFSALHGGFTPAIGLGASSGKVPGCLSSQPLSVALSESNVWLAACLVWRVCIGREGGGGG